MARPELATLQPVGAHALDLGELQAVRSTAEDTATSWPGVFTESSARAAQPVNSRGTWEVLVTGCSTRPKVGGGEAPTAGPPCGPARASGH